MNTVFLSAIADENYLFRFGFLLLILAPFALMLGITPIDIIIYSIDLLFIISCILKKEFLWINDTWVKIFTVLWLYMIVRGFFTLDPLLSVSQSIIFARFALFALALQYWLLKKSPARESLVIAIILTLIFASFDGLLQLFTANDLFGRKIPPVDFHSYWRLTAISGKMNIGTKSVMLLLPAIAYLLKLTCSSAKILSRCFYLFLIIVLILFVPLTGERNASLMLALGLFLLFVIYQPYRKPLLGVAAACVLGLGLILSFSPGLKDRLFSTLHVSSSVISNSLPTTTDVTKDSSVAYVALLKTDWNIFLNNPLFGIGRKQYNLYCTQADASIAITKTYIHQCITSAQNIYLEWLDETGLVGTILFLAIVFTWFRTCYSKWTYFLMNAVALAALIEIFLRLWPLASTSSFFFAWNGGPFWLMLGWVFACLDENYPKSI